MSLDFLRQCGYWLQALAEHSRNARLSRVQLLALQQRKFRRLAHYAYERSPYYRRLMQQLGLDPATCRSEDFPVLTKQETIEHYDEIVTDRRIKLADVAAFATQRANQNEAFLGKYQIGHTTGTSGTILYQIFTQREWIQGSSTIARVSSKFRWPKRIAVVLPLHSRFTGVQMMAALNRGPSRLFCNVRLLEIGWDFDHLVRELNEFQPHFLTSFASCMKRLGDAQATGQLRISPDAIGTGGEILTPAVRDSIESAFGLPVKNVYGCTEGLYLGLAMAGDAGLYLQEDETIFELHYDHLCITPLFSLTLPLIRYRLNDILVPEPMANSKLPLQRICDVVGRQEHVLTYRNTCGREEFFYWSTFACLTLPEVAAFQMVGVGPRGLIMRVRYHATLTEQAKAATSARLAAIMRNLCDEKYLSHVVCQVVETPDLAPDPRTGKFRHVVVDDSAAENLVAIAAHSR